MGLKGQLACDVLPLEAKDVYLFSSDLVHTSVVRCHDSQRESQNHKGSRDQPLGGEGMLGNFQQNSRILILCIYSLSNVYNNLNTKTFRIKIGCKGQQGQPPLVGEECGVTHQL